MLCWDAVRRLLEPVDAVVGDPSPVFALDSPEALHFLDHHAFKLAARAGRVVSLRFAREPQAWLAARLEPAGLAIPNEGTDAHAYAPGAILAWLAATTDADQMESLWRDYLTSVDCEFRIRAGASLEASWPHLRLGFVTGVDLFHCGEFYAAHEDWESLWMRLPSGGEKSVVQGLIQLCGAFIHRLKGRASPARTMLEKAHANIKRGAETVDWIDIPQLLDASAAIVSQPLAAHVPWPEIPLVNRHAQVPRKHR
jgi:hypothetical protein